MKLADLSQFFYVSAVEKAINEGKYIRVLPDYSFEKLDFYMLKRVQDDPKINAFGDFIEECLVGL